MKRKYQVLRQKFNAWTQAKCPGFELACSNWLLLAPSALVVLLGLGLFSMLTPIFIFLGVTLALLGVCALYLSWRFIKFKCRVERFLKDIDGRVIVAGMGLHDAHQKEQLAQSLPAKKILYH